MTLYQNQLLSQPHLKNQAIANNLSALMKQTNTNISQLSQALGLPTMTIRRLLSGETEDPRLSTLKMIACHFNVSIDQLVADNSSHNLLSSTPIHSFSVPKLTWEQLPKLIPFQSANWITWNDWQPISLQNNQIISNQSFSLDSRPSMHPRFPKGTVFIIDPQIKPTDGDIVFIQLKDTNEFTLRELIIDPPDWHLSSLVANSTTIHFSEQKHRLIGTCAMTILFNPNINNVPIN